MQNIDPLYFLTPIIVIGFSFGLILYWRFKRCFSKWVLIYSAVAYFGAIALKYAIQIPTINSVETAFGNSPVVLGIYYGVQTGVFEVGGAFLVAVIAVSRNNFRARDAGGYGLGLAFWENGILIGLVTLIDYATYYSILSNPSSPLAQILYPTLIKNSPALFYAPSSALPLIGYAILERVSSLLAHFSWGLLAVLGAVYKRRIYFALAFPIGFLIDFLTPFSTRLGIGFFELVIFIVAIGGLVASLAITRRVRGITSIEAASTPITNGGKIQGANVQQPSVKDPENQMGSIVCPKCGAEFDKPGFPQRRHGFGIGLSTLAGIGDYQCPQCGYKGSTDEFKLGEH
jgi:DNA-directed RNA polymerase subunit RPC12/RpoP